LPVLKTKIMSVSTILKLSKALCSAFFLGLFFMGCQPSEETNNDETMKFIDPANFDPTVRVQDNFFKAANGHWLDNNPVPSDKSRWGSFIILHEQNRDNLKKIVDEVSQDATAEVGSNRQKVRDFYRSGMDTAKTEELGFDPLKEKFENIDKIGSVQELLDYTGYLHTQTIHGMFGMSVAPDEKNPEVYILNAYQGGLGLPERDYYFNEDPRSKKIQDEYIQHLTSLFRLIGYSEDESAEAAQKVYGLEKGLAENCRKRVDLRDAEKNYNKFTLEELQVAYSNFDWTKVLEAREIPMQEEIVVGQPEFFEGLEDMLGKVSIEDWKLYLKWKVITEAAPFLSSDFEKENFRFYSTVLRGVEEMEPRWKRVINMLNSALGDAMSELYVEKYFPPEAKKVADEMIDDITAAFSERIENLEWMGDTTKQKAKEKLAMFGRKIGYPDKWKDYSSFDISADAYLNNVRKASVFEYKRNSSKLGQPIDKEEWHMPASIVNAYYSPVMNEVVFPAGILQFPFFDFKADAAINYGAIGAVIGHELTHGFDDQGSKFAGDGSLSTWWTDKDLQAFEAKTQVLVDQYNSYTVLDTMHVDGQLTLGENIADIGGITIAYQALQMNYERNGRPEDIDGFTPEQRFFYSFAQIWRIQSKPEAAEQRIKTDPHSPPIHRVNGVVMNFQPFYDAFEVKEGDGMFRNPEERPLIW
jgi:putative endopeptidase